MGHGAECKTGGDVASKRTSRRALFVVLQRSEAQGDVPSIPLRAASISSNFAAASRCILGSTCE